MSRVSKTAIWLGALAVAGAIGLAGTAAAQTVADGSWREETRQGKCITVKEKSPAGEYKETRRCE